MIRIIKNISLLLLAPFVLNSQPLAFTGAEGAGKFTAGGRGGKVIEVTNLNDSGEGSLRAAIDTRGARTVVFRVSGTILLKSDLKIKNDSITIAGQTAPGDGICIRDFQTVVDANEVIIRYLRFRLGDETQRDTDAIWGRLRKNIIIDHCSMSWSVDECGSFYGNENFTMQWCILSESLYMSTHPKGAHGYGGIWGGINASFHHNLLAHHSSRNPRFSGGETTPCTNVDFRNNVIFNWGFNSAYGGEAGKINMVANYFKSGPATKSGVRNRIVAIDDAAGKWFIKDNYMHGYPEITNDNWLGGVQGGSAKNSAIRLQEPNPFIPINEHSAIGAFNHVLSNAGALLPKRDAIDSRIVNEVLSGTPTFDGRFYEIQQGFSDTLVIRGIIDSQKDVGGWIEMKSVAAPKDTDHDGMPDDWENSKGLDPSNPDDRNLLNPDGSTKLEEYLNFTGNVVSIETTAPLPDKMKLFQNFPNPFNPSTRIKITVSEPENLRIAVYNILGQQVAIIGEGLFNPGNYQFKWDGKNHNNEPCSAGVYFCRLSNGKTNQIIKMNLIK